MLNGCLYLQLIFSVKSSDNAFRAMFNMTILKHGQITSISHRFTGRKKESGQPNSQTLKPEP